MLALKKIPIAICIILLCGSLMLSAGIVQAGQTAFSIIENYMGTAVTVNGVWGAEEWLPTDAWITYMSGTATKFGYKMDTSPGPYMMSWAFESADTTNDAGDIWQICIDGTNDEGATPKADDNKIEITGTTLKVYRGSGTAWAEMSGATVNWQKSIATGHWVLELQADKGTLGDWGASAPPQGMRVAMYDASTQKWTSWPPASTADNPASWGLIANIDTTLPEGLSFGIVALLSTAVIAGAFVLSKRTKSANLALLTHK